jgi:hypothetical protein
VGGVTRVLRLAALALAVSLAIGAGLTEAQAYPRWSDPPYADPPFFCPNGSPMDHARLFLNDPTVAVNPEQNTFWGWHQNPGWDAWYGHWYGDFRGAYDDNSGWVYLMTVPYGQVGHWNFASSGWQVHGHVTQYIAYYNTTFGGQCGWGSYGNASAPPYMADVIGYPIVDIYVDAVPPYTPQPAVTAVSSSSVTFGWNSVADRGDGGGQGFWTAGMKSYTSYATVNGGSRQQVATTSAPRSITVSGLGPGDTACVSADATDQVGNSSPFGSACAKALSPPPMPAFDLPAPVIAANPAPAGLAGFESWFWLQPPPAPQSVTESANGYTYQVTATPVSTAWAFGDGGAATLSGAAGYGQPYPQHSTVAWTYEAQSASNRVTATETYAVSWTAVVAGTTYGPYPLGSVAGPESQLDYPVQQAEPELVG